LIVIRKEEDQFLELAQKVMSLPTAPFCEHLVAAFVHNFVAELPTLSLSEDSFGNLLLIHEGDETQPRQGGHLIATAHMDHPGLVFEERLSGQDFLFSKKGGIPLHHAVNAAVCIFDIRQPASQSPIRGHITARLDGPDVAFNVRVDSGIAEAEVAESIRPGSFAMWDLVAFEQQNRRIIGRACDDLAGLTCGLYYLLTLSRCKSPKRAGLLLTRAEEIGFGGMAAAIAAQTLDKDDVYVNIECSNAESAAALLGGGPVVRVGDRLSTFDPQITAGLNFLGAELGEDFRFQRKLMDGGACEASLLMQNGFRTGAVALPLDNYHNNGKEGVQAEQIHLDDALGLVELLVTLATSPDGVNEVFTTASANLRAGFEQGQQQHAARLRETRQLSQYQ